MIDYRIDLSKPYLIVDQDETHVLIEGCSRVIETTDGEFGGVCGTWRIPKQKLLTKQQKRALRWKRRLIGDRAADAEYKRLCELVIATHSNNVSE